MWRVPPPTRSSGMKKRMNSFDPAMEVDPYPRWPEKNPGSGHKNAPHATMGYKGIRTDYLPQSTVVIPTIALGGPERTYQ